MARDGCRPEASGLEGVAPAAPAGVGDHRAAGRHAWGLNPHPKKLGTVIVEPQQPGKTEIATPSCPEG